MEYFSLKTIVTFLLLSVIAVPDATWAKQGQDNVGDTLTSKASATQLDAITSTATRTLRYITQARNAIHRNDLDQAREEVQQARELLILVEAARPTVRLKEHIWVVRQHMEYESAQNIIDDLTLLDTELLSLGDVMPTAKAHRHLQTTQALMNENNTKAARQELDRLEASLVFTEFDLPLAACEQQILMAQEALAQNQSATADKNLVAAEESIQFIILGGSAPLASARTLLSRAAKNYANEYYAAARSDLVQASERLRRAGKDTDEKGQKEAQKLAVEIDTLKDKLDAESDDHTHTLSSFSHRIAVLVEREAHELWTRYKRIRAAGETMRKLMDAKIHLHYAEHDLVKGRSTDAIRKQLGFADLYLEEGLSTAKPPVHERISQLREQVRSLEEDLGGDREQARVRYENTMSDLINLIHEL
jgi:hypothetical protein